MLIIDKTAADNPSQVSKRSILMTLFKMFGGFKANFKSKKNKNISDDTVICTAYKIISEFDTPKYFYITPQHNAAIQRQPLNISSPNIATNGMPTINHSQSIPNITISDHSESVAILKNPTTPTVPFPAPRAKSVELSTFKTVAIPKQTTAEPTTPSTNRPKEDTLSKLTATNTKENEEKIPKTNASKTTATIGDKKAVKIKKKREPKRVDVNHIPNIKKEPREVFTDEPHTIDKTLGETNDIDIYAETTNKSTLIFMTQGQDDKHLHNRQDGNKKNITGESNSALEPPINKINFEKKDEKLKSTRDENTLKTKRDENMLKTKSKAKKKREAPKVVEEPKERDTKNDETSNKSTYDDYDKKTVGREVQFGNSTYSSQAASIFFDDDEPTIQRPRNIHYDDNASEASA